MKKYITKTASSAKLETVHKGPLDKSAPRHILYAKTAEGNSSGVTKTDFKRLARMKDSEIDYSDIPELDESFFRNAQVVLPEPKAAVSIRLDTDVLKWFKNQGRGYQTKINAVLKTYVKAHVH